MLVSKDCLPERDEFLRVFLSNQQNATLNNAHANGPIRTEVNLEEIKFSLKRGQRYTKSRVGFTCTNRDFTHNSSPPASGLKRSLWFFCYRRRQ